VVIEIEAFETKFTEALVMGINKEKLLSVNLILCLNDRFVTVDNKFRKSYRQPQ